MKFKIEIHRSKRFIVFENGEQIESFAKAIDVFDHIINKGDYFKDNVEMTPEVLDAIMSSFSGIY